MGLTDEGEEWALEAMLRGAANSADLWVGLYTGTEPIETATLAVGVTEVSGGSYVRMTIERSATGWPTLALSGGNFQALSKLVTFPTPSASWGTVTGAFLTDVSTGTAGLLLATYHFSSGQAVTLGDPAPALYLAQKAA